MDLISAREAVVTWMLARRAQSDLYFCGHPEALKALGWVGLDWEASVSVSSSEVRDRFEELFQGSDGWYLGDLRVMDRSGHVGAAASWILLASRYGVGTILRDRGRDRSAERELAARMGVKPAEVTWLAPLEGAQGTLEQQSARGILSEGVLSYLAESAWRPPGDKVGLSRAELLRTFDPAGLRTEPVRFDPEELERRHLEFLRELTPSELLERSLGFWPGWLLP
ncbi:MAG: hypothetical protein AB1758_21170, partial [Candidatus Eremiobacterota bacterium]